MKILILGSGGQLGQQLVKKLSLNFTVMHFGRPELDITNYFETEKTVSSALPDILINAAAYTAVDKAETCHKLAFQVNSKAVKNLASLSKKYEFHLIHFSTDYVFDGFKQLPYTEFDRVMPQSIYGKSKVEGENAIFQSACSHTIFRTSWVYSLKGKNFANSILNAAQTRSDLTIVDDQFGIPTSVNFISDMMEKYLLCLSDSSADKFQNKNIFNVVPSGKTNWLNFALYLIGGLKKRNIVFRALSENIKGISSENYGAIAQRPSNSCLDNKKLMNFLSISEPPAWENGADYFINLKCKEILNET